MEQKTPSTFQNGNNSQKTELKPQDLRIGNILKEGIVTEIHKECFYIWNDKLQQSLKSTWAEINPEILTQDMLLRFGFEKNSRWFDLGSISLSPFSDGTFKVQYTGSLISVNLKFVHKLQNLYYDLEDKELKLK